MKWRYVAGFLFCGDRVALIEKLKPAWQRGKLNAIGGKIEPEESMDQAMRREFCEETGVDCDTWEHFVSLGKPGIFHVEFYRTFSTDIDKVTTQEEEPIRIVPIEDVLSGKVPTLWNIRWLLPLALDGDLKTPLVIQEK